MRIFVVLIGMLFSLQVSAGASEWVPFEQESGHVQIKVVVAGIESTAIIDSGSQVNAINLRFMKAQGLEFESKKTRRVKGVYSTHDRPVYNDVPTNVLGLDIKQNLVGLPFGRSDIAMIIGAPMLEQFIMQLDYPNSRLRIVTRDEIDLDDIENVEMRPRRGSGQPLVKVSLNDETDVWLILDTGNSGGVYTKRIVANSYDWLTKFGATTSYAMGANSISQVELFKLPKIKIGPFEVKDVKAAVPGQGQEANFGPRYKHTRSRIRGVPVSGLLGYDVLKHFILTIDYDKGKGHLYAPETP